ncbi:MAG: hypothetical protein K9N00_06535 [Candidatus Marinimicrobia bacterium]|nr:hypothetical protein [Candidatus Neomarinimicrobiota bacterium]
MKNRRTRYLMKLALGFVLSAYFLLAGDYEFKIAYTGSSQGRIGPCG